MSQFVNLKRIEFVVTYRCISHCKHCQVDARQRASRPAALSPELAGRAVRELCAAYPITSVMTFGGEPLLYPETVYAAHAAARDCGIHGLGVITSAGTPCRKEDFRTVARKLAESGVNNMCISVDAFHQEYIPLEVVRQNVGELLEAGIKDLEWNVCWVISPEHDNPWNARTRQIRSALADLPVAYHGDKPMRVTPMGFAPENLAEYLPPRLRYPNGRCGEIHYTGPLDEIDCVSVEPDGSLSVCFDLKIGSLHDQNAAKICEGYDPRQSPLSRIILEKGPFGLLEEAQRRGVQPDPRGYASACSMCIDLRRGLES
jgi:pyruvate-formate lyase-activating enzyme